MMPIHTFNRLPWRGVLLGLVVAALTLLPGLGLAQETITPDGTIAIEIRKGTVIRLERPAAAVFVADPEVADVQVQSPTLVYLFGRRAGTTSLFAVDEQDQILLRRNVVVSHDLSGLRGAVRALLPDARIDVQSVDRNIVLSGEVRSPLQAQEVMTLAGGFLGEDETLINRLTVGAATQVHLRVRIAEVSRDVTKEFGINWEALINSGDFLFGLATGRDVVNPLGEFTRSATGADSLAAGFNTNDANVNTVLDALAEEGLVSILAEPSLTALSGETASFLAGGEFPIPVSEDDDGVSISFKEFGVSLAFTPTVLSGNRIGMRVRPEVSELSDAGAITLDSVTVPGLTTRRAETSVELASGQSFAIGGLLSNDVTNTLSKFPGLGDLPILGTLFRSQRFQRNETELVIIVTPYLVRPVDSPQRLASPIDGYRAPTDLERILEGRLHGAGVRRGAGALQVPGGRRLAGPVGFVLD